MIKVAIAGINGRMGRASAPVILADSELKLVGAFGKADAAYVGSDIAEVASLKQDTGVKISKKADECFTVGKPDVLLDFTIAESAVAHAKSALDHGIRPVIGVSGLSNEAVDELKSLASSKKIGGMIVPN